MKIPYYPGCDLYTKAKPLNDSLKAVFGAVDVELYELPNWYCCGTTFNLTMDNRMSLIAPLRILARAQKENGVCLVPCSICYNTLKRANYILNQDSEVLKIINEHLGESYDGKMKILHPFEFIKENKNLFKNAVKQELKGLNLGCYYGCYLLRPKQEMQFDDPEAPTIIEEFVSLIGANPVSFPLKVECCGSYLIINSPDAAIDASYKILKNARENGAEALITSCPLCHYNLDNFQKKMMETHPDHQPIPIFYFSQVSAIALDLPQEYWGLVYNKTSPVEVLKRHKVL
uniref:Disulfide reductase n=1 Tax=candidate division WOR-3 bacterium TaxID=2052148 RepID=A0A7C4TAE6_UNCW3